jgi:transcriptional regulator with XRE-family HTH domain
MNDTINERIDYLINQFAKNQSDFANKIGKPSQTISNIVLRGTKPGSEILEAILNVYPQVDALWLVCGIGEMQRNLVNAKEESKVLVEILKKENEVLVKNNDSLLKDKERLWELVEDFRKKLESNEDTRDSNLVVLDMTAYLESAYKLTA